jgi:hypothetical protein
MKKAFFVLVVAFVVAGMASAQGYGYGTTPSQSVSISGVLGLQNGAANNSLGAITVSDGKTTYAVPALNRYIGFIDGFKEGAQVTVQGYLCAYNTLMPATLTINGKSYTVGANNYSGTGWHHDEGGGHHGRRHW